MAGARSGWGFAGSERSVGGLAAGAGEGLKCVASGVCSPVVIIVIVLDNSRIVQSGAWAP